MERLKDENVELCRKLGLLLVFNLSKQLKKIKR